MINGVRSGRGVVAGAAAFLSSVIALIIVMLAVMNHPAGHFSPQEVHAAIIVSGIGIVVGAYLFYWSAKEA